MAIGGNLQINMISETHSHIFVRDKGKEHWKICSR